MSLVRELVGGSHCNQGMSFAYGSVYGDLKAYNRTLANWLCCGICSGPMLLVVGVALVLRSFQDIRLQRITEFNVAAEEWNTHQGASGSFQGIGINATLTSEVSTQHVLFGGVAPEPLGDKSLRPVEAFTSVDTPYFFKTKVTVKKNSRVMLHFTGNDVSASSSLEFDPIVQVDVKYKWYVSRSSSAGSNSIDCRDSEYDYPGTRFKNVETCQQWCEQEMQGSWVGSTSRKCFDTANPTKATGCCTVAWAAKLVCVAAKDGTSARKINIGEGTGYVVNGCSWSEGAIGDSFQRRYTSVNASGTSLDRNMRGGASKKFSDWPVVYGILSRKDPKFAADNLDLDISVRHELDPYISASRITKGCSSGTDSKVYSSIGQSPSETEQCFGMTPEQTRQIAVYCFGLGTILSIVPCGLIYFIVKRQRAKKPGIQQRTQVAPVAPVVNGVGGGVIVLAGPQRTQQLQPQIQQVQYPMQPLVVVAVPQQQQVHQQQIQYAQVQSY